MRTSPSTKSLDSTENPPYQGRSYLEKFGEPVPTNLWKFCANTGSGKELLRQILERIKNNDPVTDWAEFAKQFQLPSNEGL